MLVPMYYHLYMRINQTGIFVLIIKAGKLLFQISYSERNKETVHRKSIGYNLLEILHKYSNRGSIE